LWALDKSEPRKGETGMEDGTARIEEVLRETAERDGDPADLEAIAARLSGAAARLRHEAYQLRRAEEERGG
jgi:hypothetical protein